MYAWPDYYGYDPVRLQQYGYGYYPEYGAQQWGWGGPGWGRRAWIWPFLFLPFFFPRWWW
ncbi:MAG: hypothetical protein ACM3X4_12355 [Ignavibacteriales bacterium]